MLLRRGAAQVIALDVGHGQLDPRIADDPRVIEMSGVNMRYVGSTTCHIGRTSLSPTSRSSP